MLSAAQGRPDLVCYELSGAPARLPVVNPYAFRSPRRPKARILYAFSRLGQERGCNVYPGLKVTRPCFRVHVARGSDSELLRC